MKLRLLGVPLFEGETQDGCNGFTYEYSTYLGTFYKEQKLVEQWTYLESCGFTVKPPPTKERNLPDYSGKPEPVTCPHCGIPNPAWFPNETYPACRTCNGCGGKIKDPGENRDYCT